jgi:DNA-binding protein HU-beta
MTMNDLIASLAAETGLAKTQVRSVIDAFATQVEASIKIGDDVRVSGFGVFEGKRNEARDGRNPRTGEKIKIAASNVAKFRASKELKDELNG